MIDKVKYIWKSFTLYRTRFRKPKANNEMNHTITTLTKKPLIKIDQSLHKYLICSACNPADHFFKTITLLLSLQSLGKGTWKIYFRMPWILQEIEVIPPSATYAIWCHGYIYSLFIFQSWLCTRLKFIRYSFNLQLSTKII